MNKLLQIKQVLHNHALLTCVYPQLFAIQWLAENAGMESPHPRLFSASLEGAKTMLLQHPQPFLVLTSAQLSDGDGLDLIRFAKAQPQEHRCLLLLTHNHQRSQSQLISAGADALVLEESIHAQSGALLDGLRAISKGQTYRDPALGIAEDMLSDRQLEILQLVAAGLGNREIAEQLHLAPSTARDHVQAILRRLGVKTRAAAAVAGVRLGLVH